MMRLVRDSITLYLENARRKTLSMAARFPAMAMTLVIIISSLLLPLVSATVLMPVVALFYVGDYLESKGVLTVIYTICSQGMLLAFVLILLYTTSFTIATAANILHSKYYFRPAKARKNINLHYMQHNMLSSQSSSGSEK